MRNLAIIISITIIMMFSNSCRKETSESSLSVNGKGSYVLKRLFLPVSYDKINLKIITRHKVSFSVLPDIVTDVPLWELLEPASTNGSGYTYDLLPILRNPTRYFRLKSLMSSDCVDTRSILVKIGASPEDLSEIHIELETEEDGKTTQSSISLNPVDGNKNPITGDGWTTLNISGNTVREEWLSGTNPLKELPTGLTEFNEIAFQLTTKIYSATENVAPLNIPVTGQVAALHFLHAVEDADKIPLRVAIYIITYEDGKTEKIPVVTGVNIMNLTSGYGRGGSTMGSVDVQDAPVAWRGRYYGKPGRQNAAIYSFCWQNPHPETGIANIKTETAKTGKFALIAVTAEGAGARKIKALTIPEKYLFTTDTENISTDLVLENITSKNISCKGTLSLIESSSGKTISSIQINEDFATNKLIYKKYSFKFDNSLPAGCYDIKFNGQANGTTIKSKPVRIAVVNPSAKHIKGEFPQHNRAFFTMTIGDMDNRSAKKLSDLGFDVAYIQPRWALQEPAPGKYDFAAVDHAVSIAATNNLALAIGSVTWSTKEYGSNYGVPYWIKGRMVSRLGTQVKDGTIFDDNYTDTLISYWQALAEYTADIPSVIAYVPTGPGNDHMLNFGGGIYGKPGHLYDYSSYAADKWHEWLSEKSGYSLSALAKEINLSVKSYEDIPMPKYKKDYGEVLWRLWMTFRRDSVIGLWQKMASAIRSTDSKVGIEIKHSGGWLPWGNLQGSYFDETIDVIKKCGGSLLKTGSEWTDQFIVTSPLAAHQNIPVGAEMAILPPPREAFQMAMFNLMRYQGNQAVYVYWGVGEPTYNWAEYKPAWDRVLSAKIMDSSLCLLYSTWNILHNGIVEKEDVDLHRKETLAWGYLLSEKGAYFDATTDMEDIPLNRYSVIIDTNSGGHPESYWKKLEDYVRSGGTLILPYHTGSSQSYNFQQEVLGIKYGNKAKGEISLTGNNTDSADGYQADDGIELSAINANTIARWSNNSPAAIEISLGKGKVLSLGFPLAKYQHRQSTWPIVKHILGMYNITLRVDAPQLLQTALFKENENNYLLIAFNHDVDRQAEITVTLPKSEKQSNETYLITNILTGERKEVSSLIKNTINFTMTYRALKTEIMTIQKLK